MGGRLVCEFAYIRQEETESYKVNSFPFGQTHVDFVKIIFKGYSSDGGEELSGKLHTRCKHQASRKAVL
jgi:hypothetical protein